MACPEKLDVGPSATDKQQTAPRNPQKIYGFKTELH
jgi:hypothetical protein